MLIVIEGLDGSGKSTQVSLLRSYLEEKTGEVDYIHFPRYGSAVYGDLIGKFLRGDFGDMEQVHPQLVALLYAEDRKAALPEMKASLEKGRTLLLDRYVYSNIAYQCAKIPDEGRREELRRWIYDTEYGAFGLPVPDLNIFLDVPISFVSSKLSPSRTGGDREYLGGGRDIHEADLDFQCRVREVYLRQCREDQSFLRIDCSDEAGNMLSQDRIASGIRATVDHYLL